MSTELRRGQLVFYRPNPKLQRFYGVTFLCSYEKPVCIKFRDEQGEMTVQPEKIFTSAQKDAELERLQDEKNQKYADANRNIVEAVTSGAFKYCEIAEKCNLKPGSIISKTKKLMRLGFINQIDRTGKNPGRH